MLITEQEAERVTQYLDVRTAMPEQADLLFVFGTRHPEPASIAADLFKRGVGRYVVLTGGSNRFTGVGEANAHLGIVLGNGVPRERIVVESESTNTLENVVLALSEIEKRMDLQKVASVVVITKWYHCRRAMMTLNRHLPEGIRYFAVTYEPQGKSRSDWWQGEEGSRRVLQERDKISEYLERGDIKEIGEDL